MWTPRLHQQWMKSLEYLRDDREPGSQNKPELGYKDMHNLITLSI